MGNELEETANQIINTMQEAANCDDVIADDDFRQSSKKGKKRDESEDLNIMEDYWHILQ